jgi:hypothetical protein
MIIHLTIKNKYSHFALTEVPTESANVYDNLLE